MEKGSCYILHEMYFEPIFNAVSIPQNRSVIAEKMINEMIFFYLIIIISQQPVIQLKKMKCHCIESQSTFHISQNLHSN